MTGTAVRSLCRKSFLSWVIRSLICSALSTGLFPCWGLAANVNQQLGQKLNTRILKGLLKKYLTAIVNNPSHGHLTDKHIATLRIPHKLFFRKILSGGRDDQVVQLFPGKGTGGCIRYREFDRIQQFPCQGIPPVYAKAAPMGDPEHAFLVDGHTVRGTHIRGNADSYFLELQIPGGPVEKKGLHRFAGTIDVI